MLKTQCVPQLACTSSQEPIVTFLSAGVYRQTLLKIKLYKFKI